MPKYLFTDGISGVKEVQSESELNQLISSSINQDSIRIWIFNTHQWISYADFRKRVHIIPPTAGPIEEVQPTRRGFGWIKKTIAFTLAGATVFLVYNFTRIKWEKVAPLDTMATRPANVPIINTDSVIALVEFVRGQKLDKVTRTNLRIRNNWPDQILLKLQATKEQSNTGFRFSDLVLTLDNATGYFIDDAIVELEVWDKGDKIQTDTISFSKIDYVSPVAVQPSKVYRADSFAINFQSIKAKSFNFCYSADKQSNYGNLGDRWFCK